MKTYVDETPYSPRFYFSTIFPFKTLITQQQYILPLRHMAKKYMESSQERKSSLISCSLYDTYNA